MRKAFEVALRAIEGTSEPVSLIREPPKKLPKPTPKVVMASPVTFWLARKVTVSTQYRSPIRKEPSRQHSRGMAIVSTGFIASALPPQECSYKKDPMTPEIAPTYMTPGIPRFRFPDFCVIVSPVLPSISGMLCATIRGIKATISNICLILPLLFAVYGICLTGRCCAGCKGG